MKSDVIRELHALLHERLFGGGPWLAEAEICHTIFAKFVELGLEEQVSEKSGSWRATALGRELNSQLLMVFAGVWDDSDIPMILEEYGLLSEEETTEIYERFEGGESSEVLLLPIVRRAFFQHFGTNAIVN
jgi:hypothetical protein